MNGRFRMGPAGPRNARSVTAAIFTEPAQGGAVASGIVTARAAGDPAEISP